MVQQGTLPPLFVTSLPVVPLSVMSAQRTVGRRGTARVGGERVGGDNSQVCPERQGAFLIGQSWGGGGGGGRLVCLAGRVMGEGTVYSRYCCLGCGHQP